MSDLLFEMPALHTQPLDFGLNNRQHNASEYQRFADSDYQVIQQDANFLLAYSMDDGKLEYFVLNLREKTLVYYVEAEPHQIAGLGNCATQVVLWRRAGAGLPAITTKVFYGELLAKFDSVVSDEVQTLDGRRFWIDRMAESAQKGLSVGFLNKQSIVSVYNPEVSIQQWLTAYNGWGESVDFSAYRYFISNKPMKPTPLPAE